MKAKAPVLTAAAGRKLLRRIQRAEKQNRALEERIEAVEAVFGRLAGKDFRDL